MKNNSANFDQWMNPEGSIEVVDMMQNDWDLLSSAIAASDLSLRKRKQKTAKLFSAAAMIILLISSSIILMQSRNYTTIKAPSKSELAYTLPDGSTVVLSNGSKIKFAKKFNNGKRLVNLKGEADFDVVSGLNDPFFVKTGETIVQVTGTSFKISAIRSSEEIAVQVNSGKVLFYNSATLTADSFRVGLGPGDTGIYLPKLKQLNKSQTLSRP